MYAFLGIALRFLHDIHWCRVWGIRWQRRLPPVLVILALTVWIGTGRNGIEMVAGLLGTAVVVGLGPWLAQRRFYVVFRPEAVLPSVPLQPLTPTDKVPVRVSGRLGVEGREQVFTELSGYYRTYASREHAVLARKTPRRGRICREEDPHVMGMWYLFITPAELVRVEAGRLYFGAHGRPALRLSYRHRDRHGRATNAIAFLSFADEIDRSRVQGDLLYDRGKHSDRSPVVD